MTSPPQPVDPELRAERSAANASQYDDLVEAYDRLEGVFGLTERLSLRRQEGDVVKVLLELIGRLMPFEDAAVLWLSPEDGALEPSPITTPGSRLSRVIREAVANGYVSWAISTERVITDPEAAADALVIYLPLVAPGGRLGVIGIEVPDNGVGLRRHQLGALTMLTHHGAIAIENARLYQSVQEQNRELTMLSQDLERSQKDLALWGEYLERQIETRTKELRKAHVKLQEQHDSLVVAHREQDRANERLLELDRLKSEFLQTVSHELKTPLNAIIGYSELLLDGIAGGLDPLQSTHVSKIHGSAQHLHDLIVELLDLTRMEAGRVRLNRSRFRIHRAIEAAISLVAPSACDRAIDLHFAGGEAVEEIDADESKIRQITINLLQNAVNYTPEGGDVFIGIERVEASSPGARLSSTGAFCRLYVSDNGAGVKPDAQKRIFDRFTRLGPPGSAGSGLGLPISYRLAELHGGSVWVVSPGDRPPAGDRGVGSTFYVAIPIEPRATARNESAVQLPPVN